MLKKNFAITAASVLAMGAAAQAAAASNATGDFRPVVLINHQEVPMSASSAMEQLAGDELQQSIDGPCLYLWATNAPHDLLVMMGCN